MSSGAQGRNLSARIAEIEREFSDFSYQSSHDAVAPFRHMSGYAALLNDALARDDVARAKHFSALIGAAAEECQRRLDVLLLYSRAQTAPMTPAVCDANQLVGVTRLRQSSLLGAKGIRVNVDALAPVIADAALLGRALEHMLRAIASSRAPRPQGYAIDIKAVTSQPWRLAVTDDGPPLIEADVLHAFEIRLDESASAEWGGWGVDLVIARRIFRRHGGDVAFVPIDGGVRLEAWLPQIMESQSD